MLPPLGRPGPVLIDLPKDILMAEIVYLGERVRPKAVARYQPVTEPAAEGIKAAVAAMKRAERPVIYGGGGRQFRPPRV